jgi:cephalosporin-C deacetylase-like acetyl esterase
MWAIQEGAAWSTRRPDGPRRATRTSLWTRAARATAERWGETADPHPTAGEVAYAGLMTRGAGRREDYYYRRVCVDAFRAVEAAQSHPEVDPSRVILAGGSQSGGIVVAVSGLAAGRLDGVIMQDLAK